MVSPRRYINGKVNWFDGVDSNEFSIHELSEMLKLLGYKNERMFYHFKIPNNGLDLGLKPLVSDSDVIDMVKQVGSMKVIEVYIELWLSAIDYESVSKPAKMSTIDTNLPKSMSNPLPMRKKGVANNEPRVVKEKGESSMPNIGEDDDVLVNEDNIIEDVPVDMGNFRRKCKKNVEWEGFTEHQIENNDDFEDEELNLEDFDSETGCEGDVEAERNKALRKLAKQQPFLEVKGLCLRIAKANCRAKQIAKEKVVRDYTGQYSLLRDYSLELQRTNPGITVKIEVERNTDQEDNCNTRQFKRIYVCLGALKNGFKPGNRDLLGLDGCFMSGPWPRQILTAVGVDCNGTYPIAYAVVEAKTKDVWMWFLDYLGDDLDLTSESNFTFISNRQKGILPAIKFLWKCATSTTIQYFDKNMDELKDTCKDAYEWLKKIPVVHWSRSYFSGRAHCDVLLNNICEVISKYDGTLTSNATKLLNVITKQAAQYKVEWNGDDQYQVTGVRGDQCVVNISTKVCTCRRWELTRIPCKHAVVAINDMGNNGMEIAHKPPPVSSPAKPSQGIVIRDSPSANTRSSRRQVSSQPVAAKKTGKGKLTAKEKAKQMTD
ncbi:mutator type transposase [Tanacetum coccineum]